jgi:site-specific DNA recombinase
VLTVAYCRVSTEEQADEGFSIEGQTDKLRLYASLRDLGEVTVISDPGLSGKNLKRAGLQQLLAAVEAGHVTHVIVWRLDRLSRNLGDLILLADMFGERGVNLHSVSENLDLSSASGRMFYNVLGSFAQYFREQLSENVKMGNERAVKEGRWINRPKTGYDLEDGALVRNDDATRVQEIFRLRGKGRSYRIIEDQTGIKYSTVCAILNSRIYLGEVLHNETWHPGSHEAIITEEEWHAAHRRLSKGVQPSRDVLSGRVRCGLCGRRMAVLQNGKGSVTYKCRHRGEGCDQPARSTKGLARAVVFGLSLLGGDERLQGAIRRRLAGGTRAAPARARRGRRPAPGDALGTLSENRRRLLELFYAGNITPEGFKEGEDRLLIAIEAAREQASIIQAEKSAQNDLELRFEQVASILRNLDIDRVWATAEVEERRVLVEELLESITVLPDHLEVKVTGAPTLNVLYGEVGLKVPDCWCRRPDVNPHAKRNNPNLKIGGQIEDYWALTGLIVGLIFLQHHETRPTHDNTIP